MASFSTLATLSAEAIEEFTVLYGEYLDEHNVTGAPAPNEIKYWMLFKLTRGDFADEDSIITKKTKVSNKNASKEAEEQPEQPEQHEQPEQPEPSDEESVPPTPSSNMRKAHTLKSSRIEVSVQGSDKVHKLELPFLPNCVDYSMTCQALKLNGNLLTPCLTKKSTKEGGDLCAACSKAKAPLGRICDRMKFPIGHYVVEAETGKTKKVQKKEEITFGTYIAKRGLTREQVEDKINQVFSGEIVIPEEHWVVDEKKAQKTVSAKSSETGSSDGDSVASSKKSSKPRKTKKSEKAAEVASDEEESQPEELPEPKDEEEKEQVNNEETSQQEIVEPPCEDEMEEGEVNNDSDDDASVVDASDSEEEEKVEEKQQEKVEEKQQEKVEEKQQERQKTKPALKKKKPAVKKTTKPASQSSQLEEEEPCEY